MVRAARAEGARTTTTFGSLCTLHYLINDSITLVHLLRTLLKSQVKAYSLFMYIVPITKFFSGVLQDH
jgi:hypothetical protein